MKLVNRMPASPQRRGLRIPQMRVLQVLFQARGPLSRVEISKRCGNKTTVVVGRAIGYSDPDKRTVFEQTTDGGGSPGNPCPSLLTLGYVTEAELDVDGVKETAVSLTPTGRVAASRLPKLPPLRD